jgi:hypothetical protein
MQWVAHLRLGQFRGYVLQVLAPHADLLADLAQLVLRSVLEAEPPFIQVGQFKNGSLQRALTLRLFQYWRVVLAQYPHCAVAVAVVGDVGQLFLEHQAQTTTALAFLKVVSGQPH